MSKHRNSNGIALIAAIIVIAAVSVLLISYVAVVINERKRTVHETAAGSAYYIAKAGLDWAFLDLNCEYEGDNSWIDGGSANEINGVAAPVPTIGTGSEDPGNRSDYQDFGSYVDVDFPDVAESIGTYTVQIAFVNDAADTAFRENRLWVKSTGTVTETGDSIALTQLAKVRPVKNNDLNILYDTLDYSDETLDSAVDSAQDTNEIRLARGTIVEPSGLPVTITLTGGETLTVKGGYGYDFSDASRYLSVGQSIIQNTSGLAVDISGTGTVIMGDVQIE